jgi:hypothetical protein
MEVLPNAMPSKSKYRQSILKDLIFHLFLFSSAESYVYQLGLDQLALVGVEVPQVVDRVKRRRARHC